MSFQQNHSTKILSNSYHKIPAVSVKDLYKKFGDVQALKGLSFTVHKGDVYGFLGQNGSGKSTSIRVMLGLVKPDEGQVEIFGKNLYQHKNEILKKTGAVIERPDVYKYLSAYDNLAIFARLSGLSVKRDFILQQLDKVGLADRAHSKSETYSQGMKQRLGIAIALIHDPDLIILDEPTNGLDPQGITDMRNLIISLRKDHNKTVIVSSHLLSEIELVATRMLVIHQGKKVAEGEVTELLNPERSLFEIKTTNDAAALDFIRSSHWMPNFEENREGIFLRMHKKDMALLINDLVEISVGILSAEQKQSLEEYFLSLTNQTAHVEPA